MEKNLFKETVSEMKDNLEIQNEEKSDVELTDDNNELLDDVEQYGNSKCLKYIANGMDRNGIVFTFLEHN